MINSQAPLAWSIGGLAFIVVQGKDGANAVFEERKPRFLSLDLKKVEAQGHKGDQGRDTIPTRIWVRG